MRLIYSILLIVLILTLFTSCADVANIQFLDETEHTYGFWGGTWHGMIMLPAFICSLFNSDVAVYAVNNNGVFYNFGFIGGFFMLIRFVREIIKMINI